MPHPDDLPPQKDRDPHDEDLARRSRTPVATLGIIVGLIIILAGAVYVASALL